jgi:hypothetical protein
MNKLNQIKNSSVLEAALRYYMFGFSVIPVGRNKMPLVEWKHYQTERATTEQIKEWWEKYPEANIGIVTGKAFGIVVVDVEFGGRIDDLPPTVIAKTGGGGFHYYYKHPGAVVKNGVRVGNKDDKRDIRGDGGYVVAPPSVHASGNLYEWLVPPDNTPFAVFPVSLFVGSQFSEGMKTDWKELPIAEAPEGKRNSTATQYTGKLLHDLSSDLWETAGWDSLKAWNEKCSKPPIDEKELRAVFDSIIGRETARREEKEEGGNQADRLVETILNDPTMTLFHDELNNGYIKFVSGRHKEILPIGGSTFRHWLAKSYYDLHKKTLNPNVLTTALQTIAGRARFEGEAVELHTRAAMVDGTLWYDLADKEWGTVKITSDGWSVIENPPTIFKRQQHQASQVQPASGGNIRTLLQFVNITDESQQLLFLVLLVSYFIPDFPHPICYVYGPQGSAKSTISKIVRKLVDPSRMEVLSLPKKEEELVQVLSHHYMLFFDNVGRIPDSLGDLLCRAVTGSGFSKRQLYSDDDDIIYTIRANVGVNGINLTSSKPDLLERSILFELRRVEKNKRREESQLIKDFERERPNILGSIFDALAKGLALKPLMHVDALPRMADFALWGCALAEAMGYTKEAFLEAYAQNIESQNDEVLGEHIEPELLRSFMADQETWTGSASELLEHLRRIAGDMHISESDLPKTANAFSRKLSKLKTNLEEIGIEVTKDKHKRRTITIRKVSANIADIVISPQGNNDMASVGDDNELLPPL